MRAIRLYDPERFPRWSSIIGSTQFAVSHYDYKAGTWRTAAGNYSNGPEGLISEIYLQEDR